MEGSHRGEKEVKTMTDEKKNTWVHNPKTDTRWVEVPTLADTPVGRSTGCNLHECPGCSNIWSLSPYTRTNTVVSRTTPVRENGKIVDHIISAARLAGACWCGVPFPGVLVKRVTEEQANVNVKTALRIALANEGEELGVLEELQLLRTKITPSMMRLLRGERTRKAEGVA